MKKFIYLILLFPLLANGQEWKGNDDSFSASLFLSDDPEKIYSDWNNGKANGVKIDALESIMAGGAFEAIIIFSGCKANRKDKCKVVADWKIETFDGVNLGEIDGAPLWLNQKAPSKEQLQISEKGIGLVADAQDKGYIIEVKVRDLIGKRSVTLSRRVKVNET